MLDRRKKLLYTLRYRSALLPDIRITAIDMSIYSDRSTQPSVQSPCIRNCCLDEHDVCLGCGRQLQEILHWHQATAAEREAILVLASNRRAQR